MTEMNEKALKERFNPEGSILRKQQLRMLDLLLELDRICKRHNLNYWLIGGTLLGAVRHHGFIPWDDDVDVQMIREDYLKLMDILPGELPSTMAIQNRKTDHNYFYQYAKLRDRRSSIEEGVGYDRVFKEHGIYIDIFPIDRHPRCLQCLSIATIGHSYKILKRKDLDDAEIMRRVLRIVKVNEKFIFPMLRLVSKFVKGAYLDAFGVPFVVERHVEDIFPLGEMKFENHVFPVPHNSDKVLRNQYGDYMRMPPLDSIVPHVSKITIYG